MGKKFPSAVELMQAKLIRQLVAPPAHPQPASVTPAKQVRAKPVSPPKLRGTMIARAEAILAQSGGPATAPDLEEAVRAELLPRTFTRAAWRRAFEGLPPHLKLSPGSRKTPR